MHSSIGSKRNTSKRFSPSGSPLMYHYHHAYTGSPTTPAAGDYHEPFSYGGRPSPPYRFNNSPLHNRFHHHHGYHYPPPAQHHNTGNRHSSFTGFSPFRDSAGNQHQHHQWKSHQLLVYNQQQHNHHPQQQQNPAYHPMSPHSYSPRKPTSPRHRLQDFMLRRKWWNLGSFSSLFC